MAPQDDLRAVRSFTFEIPGPDGPTQMNVGAGTSLIFVGANGGGKTRLAVRIEEALGEAAHRISAHRALNLNPDVAKISERNALAGLRTGNPNENARLKHRLGSRWGGKAAVGLLTDFDYLVQVLFAEQANTSLATHRRTLAGDLTEPVQPTNFDRLAEIWKRLLPHRELHVTGDNIQVSIAGTAEKYPAGEMSDGERSIFYMIGQALVADKDSLLVVDEPELHVHPSIMSKLWDALEAARPDCAFVFITHDLYFAATRVAQKYSIESYSPSQGWKLKPVPETGFDEATTTLILGSRAPVLFVEGTHTSLDHSIYRCCFPAWTVIPRGSCEQVIHAVATMRANVDLTRITCAGLVDADDFAEAEKAFMSDRGIAILPVSEIENLILLPSVSRAIAESEGHVGLELQKCLDELAVAVFASVTPELIESATVWHTKRRIDRFFKRIEFGGPTTVAELIAHTQQQIDALDINAVAESARARLAKAVADKDLPALLAHYDNKGLLALAAAHLKRTKAKDFESWLTRVLRNNKAPAVLAAIRVVLPTLTAS